MFVGNSPAVVPKTELLHCSCSVCLCSPDLQGCMHEMKVELHQVASDSDGGERRVLCGQKILVVSLRKRGEMLGIYADNNNKEFIFACV